MAQCRHRRDPRCASSWQVACEKRDDYEKQGDGDERQRISGADAEQKSCHHPCCRESAHDSERETDRD